jgi:hypothetical protein
MITDADFTRVTELLHRDVVRTLGAPHGVYVLRRAAELREFDLVAADDKLVEDVQQEVHDTFVDTAWPACPHHAKHPLWYRDGAWYCEQLGARVAALGELAEALRP